MKHWRYTVIHQCDMEVIFPYFSLQSFVLCLAEITECAQKVAVSVRKAGKAWGVNSRSVTLSVRNTASVEMGGVSATRAGRESIATLVSFIPNWATYSVPVHDVISRSRLDNAFIHIAHAAVLSAQVCLHLMGKCQTRGCRKH